MPAKPKPKVRMHTRIERTWTSHPLISLSSIVGVITLISLLAPGVLWAVNHFQTVEDSKRMENDIRAMVATYQIANNRSISWGTVQSLKTEVLALRNRVNDCDIKSDKKETMTRLERDACAQYQQEFDDATRRFNEARRMAMESSKDK